MRHWLGRHRSLLAAGTLLAGSTLLAYTATNYGGIRAPDAEVVFLLGQSLAKSGSLHLAGNLRGYEGFGIVRSPVDGQLYSIYPPLESIALVPFIAAAERINDAGWHRGKRLPYSHYVDSGLWKHLGNVPPTDGRPHADRFLVSFVNALVSAAVVLAFFALVFLLTDSTAAASLTAAILAFATPVWHYAGTLFSEPLATLLVLLSFGCLVVDGRKTRQGRRAGGLLPLAAAGLLLGLATTTHLTALFFVPFFLFQASARLEETPAASRLRPAAAFCAGLVPMLVLLGIYNYARFGDILETGRGLSLHNRVIFRPPWSAEYWRGLYGLVLSPGKGLLTYSPAVLLGILGWRAFLLRHRTMAWALSGAVLSRVLLVPSYQDWHGGFCLGPRYLYLVTPLFLLPLGCWLRDRLERNALRQVAAVVLAGWVCAVQQFYFSLGEIFGYYHTMKSRFLSRGVDPFGADRIYLDWELSPLHNLLEFKRGPYFLKDLPFPNSAIILGGALILLAGALAVLAVLAASSRRRLNP